MAAVVAYTELLTNIHQITAFINLSTPCDRDTIFKFSSNRKAIIIQHQGTSNIIQLPCQVADNATISRPAVGINELSLRFQIARDSEFSCAEHLPGDEILWPASSLTPDSKIACRSCQNIFVDGSIYSWKDLPSENWAEMMDFWHCHKPDTEESQEAQAHAHDGTKGYSASNGLAPSHGFGLVAISYIDLLWSNCVGVQRIFKHQQQAIACSACFTIIGSSDDRESERIRLFKWSIRLQRNEAADWEAYPTQKFICAQLLESIRIQATHKFLAFSGDIRLAKEALLLWVFNPDLVYSSTCEADDGSPKRAMKILYRMVADPADFLERNFVGVDEIELPDQVLHSLRGDLESSGRTLPSSARRLQEWKIGLLNR